MESIRTRELRRSRRRAIDALQTLQVPNVHIRMSEADLLAAVENLGFARNNEKTVDYLNRFADTVGRYHDKPTERFVKSFTPLTIRPHLRQADIDAQPRQVSMGWDGNGAPWRQSY